MNIGYARVSTLGQHLDVQLDKLQQAGCVKIYQEKRSGLDDTRPELAKCLDYLREGESLVVTKLDRLARSTLHLCTIAQTLRNKGAGLVVLDQAIDTSTPTGQFTFHMLAAMAEFETALRRERQLEGIAHAQARGVRFGRLPGLTPAQIADVQAKRAAGVRIKTLMQEYHLSKSALYRYLAAPQEPQAAAAD
jgi:DNA invertase Pin-like site-specific DNA recombinase